MIAVAGYAYPTLRAALEVIAANPTMRLRLQVAWPNGLGVDTIAIHGARLHAAFAALPSTWTAELGAHNGRTCLMIWWDGARHGVHHRGRLMLHACGSPEYGLKVSEALEACARAASRHVGNPKDAAWWRVGSNLPKELWPAVSGIFGRKKYANHSAAEALAAIEAYGWRNYVDVELRDLGHNPGSHGEE